MTEGSDLTRRNRNVHITRDVESSDCFPKSRSDSKKPKQANITLNASSGTSAAEYDAGKTQAMITDHGSVVKEAHIRRSRAFSIILTL